jgi:pimeloyl-ACP methyl ester carboxylesterase
MKLEKFTCTNNRELSIRGHIFGLEENSQSKPAVILSHGFLANEKTCHDYAKLFTKCGYIAFTYDFCGGGLGCKSEGRTEDMSVLSEMSDLEAVLKFVRLHPAVQKEHISLLGCSQGGFVSAMVTKKIPDQIESLYLLYPALCIPDDARSGKMMFYKFDPHNIPDLLGKLPMKLGGDYARVVMDMDPFQEIGGFNKPVLYLHGTKDNIVDICYAKKAHTLYPNCTYIELEGAGHGFNGKYDKQAQAMIEEFALKIHPENKKEEH